MRKSQLAICIQLAMIPGNPVPIRLGPVSPYQTAFNREWYYRQFGKTILTGRSLGKSPTLRRRDDWDFIKSVLWPYHYQG